MKWLPFILAVSAAVAAGPIPKWTTRDGRAFEATLSAADGLRATFEQPGKPPVVASLASLSADDAAFVREWRTNWRHPLIVPGSLAPWPAQAIAPAGDLKSTTEDGGVFVYESANFRITSDLRIPDGAATDIARVFEATRSALIAMPLGLHAGGETERYRVSMFREGAAYGAAGGVGGSGGYYDGRTRRMLVLLPNLGITETNGIVRLDYAKNIFILKHEVTHQLISRWHGRIPMWAYEGIAEFVAALPYAQGTYSFQNTGPAMRDYLLKWRKTRDSRSIRFVPPAKLMAMTGADWKDAVGRGEAYDLYNSSGLLTYYFIQQQGGAPFAAFIDALRRGEDEAAAEKTHLLRGKTRESLEAELIALAKKLGVELTQ